MARQPLTRERIIGAASDVADRGGVAAVTMRSVAKELGVEAMSLYHHLAGKDALIDALVEHVFTQIHLPDPGTSWRAALVARADSAREILTRHPWGLGLIESRRHPPASMIRHYDTMLGILRAGGFSVRDAVHAYSVVDSYVFGFVVTEINLPMTSGETAADFATDLDITEGAFRHLAEMLAGIGPEFTFTDEFPFGLDLILDALESRVSG